jgi:hypothetical protein
MVNCVDDFEPSSLVVQQTEIYYDVRIDIDTYFKPLVEDRKVLWYNDGV